MHINATGKWKVQTRLDTHNKAEQVSESHRTSTGQVQDKFKQGLLYTDNSNIVNIVLAVGDNEMSVKGIMSALSLNGRDNFLNNYLNPAIEGGYIQMLYPNSPHHPRQRYLLTAKGLALLNINKQ